MTFVTFRDGCAPQQVGGCTPGYATRDVYYGYDLMGHLTSARFDGQSGEGVMASYDALGRQASTTTTMGRASRTLGYQYDAGGNTTRITHPDGVHFDMSYGTMSEMTNATWTFSGGTVPFMGISYDDLGRRTGIGRASSSTTYTYDAVSRLSGQSQNFARGQGNVTTGFAYNPANQIVSRSTDNDAYAWTGAVNADRTYATNGLNQYTSAGPASFAYDVNGNLVSDGSTGYVYDVENRLVQASGAHGATLVYDPLGRLFETSGGAAGVTRFLYDGSALVGEYDAGGTLLRRYMHGPGTDEPIMWDEGSAMNCSGSRFLHTDERGSIIATADCFGTYNAVNAYDENGIPKPNNTGRFQYTGQAWIPELGLYYYKARMYSPTLARFMQTDPIGYADGMNWYNYAGGDAVNGTDPSGLCEAGTKGGNNCVIPYNPNEPVKLSPIYAAMLSSAPLANVYAVYSTSYSTNANGTLTKTGSSTAYYADRSNSGGGFNGTFSGGAPGAAGEFSVANGIANAASNAAQQNANDGSVLESTRKGEWGRAATNQGTPDPYKHMKPAPGKPGFGQVKGPQTGKLSGPKPWPTNPHLGPQTSNYAPLVALEAGVVIGRGHLLS